MDIHFSETRRGFDVATFKDRYDQECSIQKSSLATEDAIWFGIDRDVHKGEQNARMHLSKQQVAELLPILANFVATGEIK